MLRKLLILSVLLFTFIFASAAVAAEQIRQNCCGAGNGRAGCEDEFTVRDSYGKTTMPKEKIFHPMRSRESFL